MEGNFICCEKVSIKDVSEDIVLATKGDKANSSYKDRVYDIVYRAIEKSKWCSEDVYKALNSCDDLSIDKISLLLSVRPKDTNLLAGGYRTHPQMQITSSSPSLSFSDDVILDIWNDDLEYEYYLEERASFSYSNALSYIHTYYDKYLVLQVNDDKKILGVLKYAMERVKDINIVIFMIDEIFRDFKRKEKKVSNLIQMMNYAQEAIEKHEDIVNKIKTRSLEFIDRRR